MSVRSIKAPSGRALAAVGLAAALAGLVGLAALALEGIGDAETTAVVVLAGLVLSALLVALALGSDVPRVARSLALAVAVVPLSVPAVWAADHHPLPAVADSFGCGSLTNPSGVTGNQRLDEACDEARNKQGVIAGVLSLLPVGAALGAVVPLAARRSDRAAAV